MKKEAQEEPQILYDTAEHMEKMRLLVQNDVIPFDIVRKVTKNLQLFGVMGHSKNGGKVVRYVGPELFDNDGNSLELKGIVGHLFSEMCGRIVMKLEEEYYFGWLDSEDYEILQVIEPDKDLIH